MLAAYDNTSPKGSISAWRSLHKSFVDGGLHWDFGELPSRLPGGSRERAHICSVKRGSREAASAGEGRALAGSRIWAASRALRSARRRRPAKVERLRGDAESGASVVAGLRRKDAWREALGCMRRGGCARGSFAEKRKKEILGDAVAKHGFRDGNQLIYQL